MNFSFRFFILVFHLFSLLTCFSLQMPPRYSTRRASRVAATVKVTTYNVLSSHLAAPSWFQACKPEFLDQNYRLESLKRKLDTECESQAVICLQEVSQTWAGPLHTYFAERGYHLINALYGNRFNNYMGISLAVPLDKYNILDVNIQKVSDTKVTPRKPKFTKFQELLNGIQSFFIKLAIFFKLYTPPSDVWGNVLYRSNEMISARLQDKTSEKTFFVGTYHMPCSFEQPTVMVAHAALSAQHLIKYAEKVSKADPVSAPNTPSKNSEVSVPKVDPIFFCGDYNFKPTSPEYELITKGKLDKEVIKHRNNALETF